MDTQSDQLRVEFTKADLRRLIVPLVIEQLFVHHRGAFGLPDGLPGGRRGGHFRRVAGGHGERAAGQRLCFSLATGGAVITGAVSGPAGSEEGRSLRPAAAAAVYGGGLLGGDGTLLPGQGFVLNVVFGQVEADAAYANTYYMIVEASIPFLALYSAGAALFRVMETPVPPCGCPPP